MPFLVFVSVTLDLMFGKIVLRYKLINCPFFGGKVVARMNLSSLCNHNYLLIVAYLLF